MTESKDIKDMTLGELVQELIDTKIKILRNAKTDRYCDDINSRVAYTMCKEIVEELERRERLYKSLELKSYGTPRTGMNGVS